LEGIIVKNLPKGKEIVTQVQEAHRLPYKINPRWNTLRHISVKLTKTKYKEKILKATRQKQQITQKEILISLSIDFQQKLCRPEAGGRIYLK